MKRAIVIVLCISMLLVSIPANAYAEDNLIMNSNGYSLGEIGGYLAGNIQTVRTMYGERKFYSANGHGFAAERGNNLIDVLTGNNAKVVGDNNIKNGADRIIINRNGQEIWVQDKYYKTASQTVESAFDNETGMYRYFDGSKKPMRLEVPKDEYKSSIELMREKIKDGKIPGVSNTDEAENLVLQGKYTYKQSVNITKAGNIDSLTYDAINGIVASTCALGITFILDYVSCRINGLSSEEALVSAIKTSLYTGGVVFATYVISNQLIKAGAGQALAPVTDKVAKSLGTEIADSLVKTFGLQGTTKQTIASGISKVLQSEIITSGAVIVVLSVDDVVNTFKGRISKEQLLENLTVTIATVAVGTLGAIGGGTLGTIILPGVGTVAGELIGGAVSGTAAGLLTDYIMKKHYYEGDAKEMYEIIVDRFQALASDYLITQEEADQIAEKLQKKLKDRVLKDMYESKDRKAFATTLMEPYFEEITKQREKITSPTQEETRAAYKNMLQGIVFLH